MDRPETGTPGSSPPEATGSTPPLRQRRRPDRKRTRRQRFAILAIILFVIVFALAWGARSCQQSRKVDAYRTYLEGVSAAIEDSATLGKQLNQIFTNPTKFSRKEFVAKLDELVVKQNEIAARAEGFEPPSTLSTEQAVFVEGMRVRAEGFKQLQAVLLASLDNETVRPGEVAALGGYFSGPDAYYMSRFYTQTRNVMSEEGVSDVPVPTATYYLTWRPFDRATIETMLSSVGKSTKLSGTHGVALVGVAVQPKDVGLQSGKTTEIAATPDLGFEVSVMNQGSVTEENVTVKGELTIPGGEVLTRTAAIETITAGQTQSAVLTGFNIPAEALSGKVSTLKLTVGPVPGERVATNNSGSYKIQFKLE